MSSGNKNFKSSIKLGNAAHKKFSSTIVKRSGGYTPKRSICPKSVSPCYADGITAAGRPMELKPWNKRAIRQGFKQLARYEKALGKKGELWVYWKDRSGVIQYKKIG